MKTNATTIGLAMFVMAVALYAGVIQPMSAALLKDRAKLTDEEVNLSQIEMSVVQLPSMKERIAQLEKTNAAFRATWIAPMLNSYAMRAKALVDAAATQAGLANIIYEEGDLRALPVPKEQLPKQRTARRSVRLRAQADYAAAVSFLLRIEKEQPLMTVQSFAVRANPQGSPDVQNVEMTLEWPSEGEVIR